MVSFLKAKADEKDTTELLSIHHSATNLVHCLGNVLKMGAVLPTVDAVNASKTNNQDHVSSQFLPPILNNRVHLN